MKFPSPRLIIAALLLALLGGVGAAMASSGAVGATKHVVCVINQDPGDTSTQQGLCLVVDDQPALPPLS